MAYPTPKMSDQPKRHECKRCRSRMRYLGKSEPAPNGHHASVFYCSDCDRRVLRG